MLLLQCSNIITIRSSLHCKAIEESINNLINCDERVIIAASMSGIEAANDLKPSSLSDPCQHCVGKNETLASIAIKYDTLPGTLSQLNKLSSHMIFPGQILKIPSVGTDTLSNIIPLKKPPPSPSLPIIKSVTQVETVRLSSQFSSYEEISLSKSSELEENFLSNSFPRASPGDQLTETLFRIRAKYITFNKGCARGKLLLTPQSVVFEPDSSDQLVELQGREEFAVILSMTSITNLRVTSDFTMFLTNSPLVSSPLAIPAKSSAHKYRAPAKESAASVGETELDEFLPSEPFPPPPEKQDQVSPRHPCLESTESDSGEIRQPMFLHLTTLQTPLDTFNSPPASLFSRLSRLRGGSDNDTQQQQQKRAKSRSEHWFAIPPSRSDSLYAFFLSWIPSLQISDSEARQDERQASFQLRFKEDHIPVSTPHSFLPSQSWDILPSVDTIREMDHRAAADAVPLPKLVGTASLLDQQLLRELNYIFPSRTVGHDLWLVYSSFVHGISLQTMYRNMETCNGPVVFVLRDSHQGVFGGVVSCPLRVSEHYYGTGESFMFQVNRHNHKVVPFYWTGLNTFFVKGDEDSISFGGGNGKPALWLDGDFYNGSSFPCNTFDNAQLSCSEDFLCTGFESWGFVGWNS